MAQKDKAIPTGRQQKGKVSMAFPIPDTLMDNLKGIDVQPPKVEAKYETVFTELAALRKRLAEVETQRDGAWIEVAQLQNEVNDATEGYKRVLAELQKHFPPHDADAYPKPDMPERKP